MFETDYPDAPAAWLDQREPRSMGLGRSHLFTGIEAALDPLIFVFSLWGLAFYFEGAVSPGYLILSVIVFSLTFPGTSQLRLPIRKLLFNVAFQWIWIAGLLLLTGLATGYFYDFSMRVLGNWLWFAPLAQVAGHLTLRAVAPQLLKLQGPARGAVIVGVNDQGVSLARQITGSAYSGIELLGFFDDRGEDRRAAAGGHPMIGKIDDLPDYVRKHRVQSIYLSLPMASRPRILQILDGLKDTTASIYFVPDMFITDLIQGRSDSVCGVTVISVCDTPFRGFNRALKRGSDIVLSVLILLAIFPVMLVIALMVKMDSPGPAIFRQRRYGLDGDQIVVYKFRSMAVTEDGSVIEQAKKNDLRLTRLGGVLRKTSLDELPQFLNVLQGRMSIVGPRPHAVAHNELYRKVIKGYMVRHKVRPGITGWAQVNGQRGETDTIEKMQARIDFDLDYLRNWSLQLDFFIIFRTVRLIFNDRSAH
jgi:putative colanic acid biosysnthesis UDP-glucose lipid carrier transferase